MGKLADGVRQALLPIVLKSSEIPKTRIESE
jgi:hypothetical protein